MRRLVLFHWLVFLLGASSAHASNLTLPATGVWNGFNHHLNIVECANVSDSAAQLRFTVRSNEGQVIAVEDAAIPSFGSSHVVLSRYPIENRYGTFSIELIGGALENGGLSCNTVIYRLSEAQSTRPIEYAYAIPVQDPLVGESFGTINSMNPSGSSSPVQNWLTVYNPGNSPWSGQIEGRNAAGAVDAGNSFVVNALAPGARLDIALGHPFGQMVGLYRIVPQNSSQPYGAYLARYGVGNSGDFSFALALEAKQTTCGEYTVPASTMDPAINWGEITNPTSVGVVVNAEVRDGFGNVLGQEDLWVAPYSQRHVYINATLGERNVGTFRVRCLGNPGPGSRLAVQTLFYGYRQGPGDLRWAYGSQGASSEASEGSAAAFSYNTFFGAANWAKFLDAAQDSSMLSASIHDLAGRPLSHRTSHLFANGGIDVAVHEQSGPNAGGLIIGYSHKNTARFRGELLRVYPDSRGGFGSILKIPAAYVDRGAQYRGALRPLPSGHWMEFRGLPQAIIGDSVSQAFMELGSDFDYLSYLNQLQAEGSNTLMIWSYIGIVNQAADSRIGYNAPRLWPWQELSTSQTPPYYFQFTNNDGFAVFNETYFERLRALIREANKRNIAIIITVHDGWTKDRFAGHPFNSANNGSLTSREQYVELADYNNEMGKTFNPLWNRQQKHQFYLEQFCDKLIRASAGFPNVMFEMLNEGEWYNQSLNRPFQVHFLDFFKARTSLPLLVNDDHVGGNHFREESNVDMISLHAPNWTTSTSVSKSFDHYAERFFSLNPLKRPLIFNEPVPEYHGITSERSAMVRLMWGTLLGGGGFLVPNDSSWKWNSSNIDPIFDLVGYAARFFHESGVHFEAMEPNGELCSSGVCLANPGVEYLVYTQSAPSVSVDLTSVSGTFMVRFFDPFSGQYATGHTTTTVGGTNLSISKPTSADWVVWYQKIN